MVDEPTFELLNAIYLRKMATSSHVAEVTGRPQDEVEHALRRMLEAGAVLDLGGQFLLEPPGTALVLDYYARTYAPARGDPSVVAWYEAFETVNTNFIKAVSDWQAVEGDERARSRMTRIVERMIRSLGDIAAIVPRYRRYADRFRRAMTLADQGTQAFICNPTVDSMHNIWFEFHEDILAVLGRPRDT